MPTDKPFWTFRDAIGGAVALTIVGAICWSALWDGSEASGTALVGGLGAVTAWLFRGTGQTPPNGPGTGSAGSGGGATPAGPVGPV